MGISHLLEIKNYNLEILIMPLIENSQDLLNIIKAVSIFGVAFFFCWLLFYLTMMLRQTFKITKDARNIFRKADEILDALKNKIEHSASYLVLISEGVKKLAEYFKDNSIKKAKRKEKKSK